MAEGRKLKHIEKCDIPFYRPVKAWYLGQNVVEVVSCDFKNTSLSKFRKINREHYVDLTSGEIFDYKLNTNRSQNTDSMRKTLHNIRRTINNNFSGGENELFVTLTYADNMQDTKKLYNDFKNFWKYLKSEYSCKYSGLEYINIIEPQGRGAWHCHVLIKCNQGQVLYIPNDDIYKFWRGKGWTKVKRLKGVDNIGAYLSAYLTDMELDFDNFGKLYEYGDTITFHEIIERKVVDDTGKAVSKKFAKGARLYLYGSMTNIIRCSRGIEKPVSVEQPYSDVKKIVGSRTPDYSKSIAIMNDILIADGQQPLSVPINTITYENYNLRR